MKQNSTDSECPDWTKLTSRKWVDLLIRQPQLADMCDFTKFDGSDWLLLLLEQPGFAERCNWDKLDERPNAYARTAITGRRSSPFWEPKLTCWSFLLSRRPQYAKYRNWDKVYGDNWREFKRLYPNAFDDANRIGLDGNNWVDVLIAHPEFANLCEWSKFDDHNWLSLLTARPQFADKYNWNYGKGDGIRQRAYLNSYGSDWITLLIAQPQFADKCDWSKFDGSNWAELLLKCPLFANKCDWSKLNGDNWASLLVEKPQFSNLCDWCELKAWDWLKLLTVQPQFADKCNWKQIDTWDETCGLNSMRSSRLFRMRSLLDKHKRPNYGTAWVAFLSEQPQFADKCDWSRLNGWCWATLLSKRPQFANKCDWSKLDGGDWASLLAKQPQFADKCDWEKLYSCSPEIVPYRWQDEISWEDDPDFTLDQYQLFCWASLLATQPQFACKCDWGRLSGKEWSMLLRRLPQYADKCDWGKLYEQATVKVEFECGGCCGECEDCGNQADCRRGYYEEPFHCWRVLLLAQPQFADRCDWARLRMTDMEWTRLLSSRPQLANYLTGEAWTLVITKNPDMANSSNLVKLSGKDWAVLLARRPEFADKCPYEKLSFPEIVRLFASAPQAIKPHFDVDECFSQAKESDWDALSCDEWIQLLEKHPKYADKCDFERFSGEETMRFLLSMLEFAKHCCIGKLYEKIGEGDNRHVCFAELLVKGTKNAFGSKRFHFRGKRFHPYDRLSEIKSLCDWSRLSCQDLKWIMRRALDFEWLFVHKCGCFHAALMADNALFMDIFAVLLGHGISMFEQNSMTRLIIVSMFRNP